MTRVFTDHRRSLNEQQTNRHRNVNSTSTDSSNRPREYTGRIAEEYGTGPRMVRW